MSCTLHLAPYTLHSLSRTLHLAHCTLHNANQTLHLPAPCTPHPTPCTPHPAPHTPHPLLHLRALHPTRYTSHPTRGQSPNAGDKAWAAPHFYPPASPASQCSQCLSKPALLDCAGSGRGQRGSCCERGELSSQPSLCFPSPVPVQMQLGPSPARLHENPLHLKPLSHLRKKKKIFWKPPPPSPCQRV